MLRGLNVHAFLLIRKLRLKEVKSLAQVIQLTNSEGEPRPSPLEVLYAPFFSHSLQLFVTPWTVAHQLPLSVGFPRKEYWSGLPVPSPGDLPDPGIQRAFPTLAGGCFTAEPPGKRLMLCNSRKFLSLLEVAVLRNIL